MSALPPYDSEAMNVAQPRSTPGVEALTRKWAALHDSAANVAAIADLATKHDHTQANELISKLAQASDWQCRLAADAIDDIDAMMQPGLTALRTLTGRGQDAVAPALALWREFYSAREAVLAMLDNTAPAAA